ncbi:MAG: NIL domain-containing protein [Dehalococcoidia bacterium]|nr:NIL domain-containing protein [Dehalococcoidia bacterium]
MATKRVRFTFEPNQIKRPVIYELGHKFEVVTSIRMADVDDSIGWVVLELEGDSDEIERSVAWAREVGVRVDDATLGDVVEGS